MEYLINLMKSTRLDVYIYINGEHYATIRNGNEERWCREHRSFIKKILDVTTKEVVVGTTISRDCKGNDHYICSEIFRIDAEMID